MVGKVSAGDSTREFPQYVFLSLVFVLSIGSQGNSPQVGLVHLLKVGLMTMAMMTSTTN